MSPSTTSLSPDQHKVQAAQKAIEYIQDGQILGLGTGSTVHHFLTTLGVRIKSGLRIRGVPTSQATATYATQLGIPLLNNEEPWKIDIAIDGADQVDPQFNLIKGGGGALLREKIVARAARQFIVIVDEAKQRPHLGLPFPLPIEILSFGWQTTQQHIEKMGWPAPRREQNGQPFLTDNGHYIVDAQIPAISDPASLETRLLHVPGVVECGLFVNMASLVITGTDHGTRLSHNPSKSAPP